MPPQPQEPKDLPENKPAGTPPSKAQVDIDSILLPKKEIHSPASAQRVNASVLLEQETNATLLPKKEEGASVPVPTPAVPKKEPELVVPLKTYQGDVEQLVEHKNVSLTHIAAAEADRRAATPTPETEPPQQKGSSFKKLSMIGLGVVLLLGAGGAVAYALLTQTTPTTRIADNPQAPFIFVDKTQLIELPPTARTRESVMSLLLTARTNVALSLGLMGRLYIATPAASADTAPQLVTLPTLLSLLAPSVPGELVRSIDPTYYTLGIHSFDENQAFLIFKVDSFATGYAGMLAWERTMYNDLLPLFNRTPSVRAGGVAATTTPPVQVLQTTFSDQVVENRDARVVQNQFGDILFLWTFLDRETVVITTNNHTLLEIITRFTDIPLVP